ncbi:zinc-dependent alcohol dehydrogenase [Promicromonospora sp. NFX87]|uniref:zinc-dependent alcohol dehydrogenase n=1 Tax=Promicromonospora sp. NFX87 TaxID=3402691 RepID=UPI003AFB72BD
MPVLELAGAERIHVVKMPVPLPAQSETVLQVELTGICGSEVHDSKFLEYRRPPVVMGHEIVGSLDNGTFVAVNPIVSCGECNECRRGQQNICDTRAVLGVHRPGGFASYVAVPLTQIVPLGPEINVLQAVMAEPLANGLHAWRLAQASPESHLAVIGAGPIGLSVILTAIAEGAAQVDVIEPTDRRRAAAVSIGARPVHAVEGRYDIVFDCAGTSAARKTSVSALNPGGIAVWLGLESRDPGFDSTTLVRAEKTVRGSYGYTPPDFSDAVKFARFIPLDWINLHPLSSGPKIFDALWHGNSSALKIALRPDHLKEMP